MFFYGGGSGNELLINGLADFYSLKVDVDFSGIFKGFFSL